MHETLLDVSATFPARPEGLDRLHAALERFFREADHAGAGLCAQDRAALVTAVGEIAANIIAHACRDLPDADVRLALARRPDCVEARFEDPGVPCLTHAPAPPGPVPHLGIGLHLAQCSVDALEYARGAHTNHWRLVRRTRSP